MLTILFGITSIVLLGLWIVQKISNLAILFFVGKKYTLPTNEEMEECTQIVVKKLLKIF